jgi:hypothetical protein
MNIKFKVNSKINSLSMGLCSSNLNFGELTRIYNNDSESEP